MFAFELVFAARNTVLMSAQLRNSTLDFSPVLVHVPELLDCTSVHRPGTDIGFDLLEVPFFSLEQLPIRSSDLGKLSKSQSLETDPSQPSR